MDERSDFAARRRRVLVGIDRSDAAAGALRWAGRLAQLDGSELVAVHMFCPDQAEVDPERYEEQLQEASGAIESGVAQVLDPLAVTYQTVVEPGTADDLLQAATQHDADLLVVGPRGEGGFANLHIGSTAHHLAHRADRPLAIVPSVRAGAPFDRIVVGIDGSTGSAAAVDWSTRCALRTGAEVLAVSSFEPFLEWVPDSDPNSIMRSVERTVHESTATMRAQGVKVRTKVVQDIHPVAALAAAVEREGAGLAVVGRRGNGGFSGLLLGRVPEQLVHHAHVPVVVVPPGGDPAPDGGV